MPLQMAQLFIGFSMRLPLHYGSGDRLFKTLMGVFMSAQISLSLSAQRSARLR
jgi:hypothetical protein